MPRLYAAGFFLELIYKAIAKLLLIDTLISRTAMPLLHAVKPAKRRVPVLPGPRYLMKLTVPAASLTSLRHIVTRVCGDALQFMRTEDCGARGHSHVCLCIPQEIATTVMHEVLRYLPDARIGALREPKLRQLARLPE